MGFGIWDLGYETWDMELGIWDLGCGTWDMGYGTWDMHTNVARLNRLVGSQSPPLDNWISNGNTYIKKR
jgi:hypothetical protein